MGTALAVLGGLGAGAAWWLHWRTQAPVREEREPNDDPARANRIAAETTVTGVLGRRRSPSEPDVDLFRLPRQGPGALTITLTGLPNIDVALTLRDAGGQIVATADEQAVAGDERLFARRVEGPVTIEVAEVMIGALAVENVSDRYRLTVHEEPADATMEREPNGDVSDALPVAPAVTVRGRLEARADVDALRWTGAAGAVAVEVAAPSPLPLTWRGPDGRERAAGRAVLTLAPGDVITLRRGDRDAAKGALPGADVVWAVTIVPQR